MDCDAMTGPTIRRTAVELGIPDDVYRALIWVRDGLDPAVREAIRPDWMVFDMNAWPMASTLIMHRRAEPPCGMPFCIGGSMHAYLAGHDLYEHPGHDTDLEDELAQRWKQTGARLRDSTMILDDLFFLYPDGRTLTPDEAVDAIDRVLGGQFTNPWLVPSDGDAM